jgi:3D (Asp-Asp-Asp) domain-containing protein
MRRAGIVLILSALVVTPRPLAAKPVARGPMLVTATAYCQHGTTASGTRARSGIVAADPKLIPVGSVLQISNGSVAGIYTVMDTGADVKGRKIDIFIPDCARAIKFGLKSLRVRVLRRGWDPKATPRD